MELLTKSEERVMQILWELKKGFVKDIIAQLPPPRPPYNTISSVVRILEKKGFIEHKAYGKTHEYYPQVTKIAYKKFAFKQMVANYFNGSMEEVVSFMVKEEELTEKDVEEILGLENKPKKFKK